VVRFYHEQAQSQPAARSFARRKVAHLFASASLFIEESAYAINRLEQLILELTFPDCVSDLEGLIRLITSTRRAVDARRPKWDIESWCHWKKNSKREKSVTAICFLAQLGGPFARLGNWDSHPSLRTLALRGRTFHLSYRSSA
jgi:hypothetical protein